MHIARFPQRSRFESCHDDSSAPPCSEAGSFLSLFTPLSGGTGLELPDTSWWCFLSLPATLPTPPGPLRPLPGGFWFESPAGVAAANAWERDWLWLSALGDAARVSVVDCEGMFWSARLRGLSTSGPEDNVSRLAVSMSCPRAGALCSISGPSTPLGSPLWPPLLKLRAVTPAESRSCSRSGAGDGDPPGWDSGDARGEACRTGDGGAVCKGVATREEECRRWGPHSWEKSFTATPTGQLPGRSAALGCWTRDRGGDACRRLSPGVPGVQPSGVGPPRSFGPVPVSGWARGRLNTAGTVQVTATRWAEGPILPRTVTSPILVLLAPPGRSADTRLPSESCPPIGSQLLSWLRLSNAGAESSALRYSPKPVSGSGNLRLCSSLISSWLEPALARWAHAPVWVWVWVWVGVAADALLHPFRTNGVVPSFPVWVWGSLRAVSS